MTTAATQIKLNKDSERAVLTYASSAHSMLLSQMSLRSNLETIDRAYMREADYTEEELRAKIANRMGDKKKFQNITVPIVMPQVQAALGYMTNVFLTGYPIFGVSAGADMEDAALQMETIIAENSIFAGWVRQLIMFFRDGLKYNLHAVECEWQERNVVTIETDIAYPNSAKPKTTLWKGNVLKRMDLYNTVFDPRVHPAEVHSEGEFAGYIELCSRVNLKKYINDLYGVVPVPTVLRALESAPASNGIGSSATPFGWYQPLINPFPTMNKNAIQTFDWMNWAQGTSNNSKPGIRYSNVYEKLKLYARIIPADFGIRVPEENTPQVWKFIIINGQVVLYAERCSNAHGYIPIFFGQPLEDGLDYQTKSFATNVSDMQDVASAMWNGYIASKRRLVGDRVIYDPLRIREKDINSTDPAAKIPVRPSAYGKPVSEAVYQFPFHDEQTRSLLEGSDMVVRFANLINQQNPAQQGQFVKGNKTKHEYDDIMGHGNSANQMMALMSEGQVFTPLKEVLKLNILQYQPDTILYNRDKNQQVPIKTTDLRKTAVHFKVSDGLMPTDKLMASDEFQTALQVIGSSPQLQGQYELGDIISYLFKMRGADLRPFQKSPQMMMFLQQLSAWQANAEKLSNMKKDILTIEDIMKVLGPQPQPSPELQQEVQAKQQAAASAPKTAETLAATQG